MLLLAAMVRESHRIIAAFWLCAAEGMQVDKVPGASVEISVEDKAGGREAAGAHQRREADDDASRSPGGYVPSLVRILCMGR